MTFLGIDFAVLRRSIEEDVEMETIGSCDANRRLRESIVTWWSPEMMAIVRLFTHSLG
ncbi:hypothetical protein F2Q70_00044376 [Brassica cretica]|uniref:Uncharacterized protein n=1 Tax=Brassica cretica TaxID=69181 RepID=A0A8S9KPU5_BRACR|nr:hypothetical protein F2Q70_00044376 [Brassica cretica]